MLNMFLQKKKKIIIINKKNTNTLIKMHRHVTETAKYNVVLTDNFYSISLVKILHGVHERVSLGHLF